MKFLVVLCVLATGSLADIVPVKDCGSQLATIGQVDITPCPNLPCPFKKNTFVNVTLAYTANSAITQAQTSVHGIIADVPVPFPLPDDDACHFMTCPINQGDTVVYKNGIFVQPAYPKATHSMPECHSGRKITYMQCCKYSSIPTNDPPIMVGALIAAV